METFKVIICGGRDFSNYELLKEKCDYFLQNKLRKNIVIICGKARGTDTLGEKYALEKGFDIEYFPADWNKYGKSDGFRRNKEMVNIADATIAFWDGKSHGTKNTIELSKEKNIPIKIIYY